MQNELDIIEAVTSGLFMRPDVVVPPGDDCAAVALPGGDWLLLAVDQLIGGVHYAGETTSPEAAGAKLMNRNLSDIAAMGGRPAWALLAVAAAGCENDWVERFCRGAALAGERFGVSVVGGDLAALPERGECASLTIAGLAGAGRILRRDGAKAGDALYVTGEIGNSFASGHHLDFVPRLAEGAFLAGRASAAIDISDGLLLDAARMAKASGVSFELDPAAVPLREGAALPGALSDGEDYELCFCAPEGFEKLFPENLTPITRIGRAIAQKEFYVVDTKGENLISQGEGGYVH